MLKHLAFSPTFDCTTCAVNTFVNEVIHSINETKPQLSPPALPQTNHMYLHQIKLKRHSTGKLLTLKSSKPKGEPSSYQDQHPPLTRTHPVLPVSVNF